MKKYGAILIDPPWGFDTFSKKGQVPARGEQPYPTMGLHEIAGLPIPELMDKSCAVFLWDNDSIPDTLGFLATAWGLRISTKNIFIWDKGSIGMGYWSRKEAEVCHLLVKGRPARHDKGVRQFVREKRREHSRKPDEIRARIERLVEGPYLEMFARQSTPNWDTWGDETTKFDEEDIFG